MYNPCMDLELDLDSELEMSLTTMGSGETYMGPEPELEWTLNSGQNVPSKYESGAGFRSGVDLPLQKLNLLWYSCGDKNLRW